MQDIKLDGTDVVITTQTTQPAVDYINNLLDEVNKQMAIIATAQQNIINIQSTITNLTA